MARVPYLNREELSPEHQASYDRIADTRGVVGPNFQALFNSPIATERFASFGEYLRFDSEIPPRLKELVILAAAREANNGYVWTAHEKLARERGVAGAIIEAIRDRSAPAGLSGDDASAVAFAKELLIDSEISDDTFAAVHGLLGDQATVDIILLILYYSSLALALQAVRVELPEGVASTL
jgi:4-carboxymuconolactone decarboxylase